MHLVCCSLFSISPLHCSDAIFCIFQELEVSYIMLGLTKMSCHSGMWIDLSNMHLCLICGQSSVSFASVLESTKTSHLTDNMCAQMHIKVE